MTQLEDLRNQRSTLIDQLFLRPSGLDWAAAHSDLADVTLQALFEDVMGHWTNPPRIALAATGGYGRRELSPWSDMDLSVIPLDDTHPDLDAVVKQLFSEIQLRCTQGLGLKVGYSFRPLAEAPGVDGATRTALLDARLVAGSREPFDALLNAIWEEFPAGDFLIEKIRERKRAHAKWHDTPLVAKPNLKEGAGGLRCFQAANWIGSALGERPARPSAAYDRVLRSRNLLHALAARAQEELTLDKRAQVAGILGKEPEVYASELSVDLLEIWNLWRSCLDRVPEARMRLTPNVWAAGGEVRIGPMAGPSEAALGVALGRQLGIKPPATPVNLVNTAVTPEALAVVGWGEDIIRSIDEAGILEDLLPELTRCRHLMPQDISHTYTVFEHTLRVIKNLDSLHEGAYLGDIRAGLRDSSVLYLAALLHDVGKADTSDEHSITGARMAAEVCERWGISSYEADLVVWLVQEHLSLDRFVRMRDVQNPEAVFEFAQFVGSEHRLDLLALLTWADVNAVNTEAWTPMQQAFLEHLHRSARAIISENASLPDISTVRKRLQRQIQGGQVDEADMAEFLQAMPANYVLSTPPEKVTEHWRMLQEAKEEGVVVRLAEQYALGVTDFTIATSDRPGLLSQILGVLYAHNLRLTSVRASTSTGASPVVVDVISASYGERTVPRQTASRIVADLLAVLRGEISADTLLESKGKDPNRSQEIVRWTWHPGSPGFLEIRAPRGRGMAYRISKLISAQGWHIQGARLAQWAGQGAAAFSITDADGKDLSFPQIEMAFGRQD